MPQSGKIKGLPMAIREELNRRLQDGEEGKELLDWLNARPEVERIWLSIYTPQSRESTPEMLTPDNRRALAEQLRGRIAWLSYSSGSIAQS